MVDTVKVLAECFYPEAFDPWGGSREDEFEAYEKSEEAWEWAEARLDLVDRSDVHDLVETTMKEPLGDLVEFIGQLETGQLSSDELIEELDNIYEALRVVPHRILDL